MLRRASLLGLLVSLSACSQSQPQAPQQPYPQQPVGYQSQVPQQPVGPPPAPPPNAVSTLLGTLAQLQSQIPCPLPGLPPQLAASIDCSTMRSVGNAVAYVPRMVIAGSLPAAVDHRATGLTGPVKDQQQVGACAGFAVTAVMDTAIRKMGRGDVVSPLHVFAKYQGVDLGLLKGVPLTAEPVWPYDPARACQFAGNDSSASNCGAYYNVPPGGAKYNPMLMGEMARADQYGYYRVDAFERMSKDDLDQIFALLADGEAVWVALDFYRPSWQSPDVKSTGYLPYYPPQNNTGHGVALQGYRVGPMGRDVLFQNSWGASWGQGGYAWIPESMLRTHLIYAYHLKVSPAGAPLPPGTAPAGGCPSGQSAILGVCVPTTSTGVPSIPGLPSSWPSGVPSSMPSTVPTCPQGQVPNPFTGGCVALPAPQ